MMQPHSALQRAQIRLDIPAAPVHGNDFRNRFGPRGEQVQPLLGLAPPDAGGDQSAFYSGLRRQTMVFASIQAAGLPFHSIVSRARYGTLKQFSGTRCG
jgi:hypothetical protein